MDNIKIGFVGGGNMASSLIGGLLQTGVPADRIHVFDPLEDARARLAANFQVHVHGDNQALCAEVDVLVLAVKPQQLQTVCAELSDTVQQRKSLVISIAAGVRAPAIERWLGGNAAVVRCMPNTPSLVGSGATGLYANAQVSDAQREQAEALLRAVGLTVWVDDEVQLDAITAVSGSGPAYYFLVMEAMQAAALDLGLDEKAARILTLQTAFGAAKMALESDASAATLRERVTSPGGTTQRALEELEKSGLRQAFSTAMQAASDRSVELADLLERTESD